MRSVPAPDGDERRVQMPDLDDRDQIHELVVRFYREVAFDELLAPVFCDVAKVNWSVHIPKLIDYWCRILLGHPGYEGYLLGPHQNVHEMETFRPELFDRWYSLFVAEVDHGWQGPMAMKAKSHAARMAATLARRLLDIDWAASDSGQVGPPPCPARIGPAPGRDLRPTAVSLPDGGAL